MFAGAELRWVGFFGGCVYFLVCESLFFLLVDGRGRQSLALGLVEVVGTRVFVKVWSPVFFSTGSSCVLRLCSFLTGWERWCRWIVLCFAFGLL